jgi:hypothetical protein
MTHQRNPVVYLLESHFAQSTEDDGEPGHCECNKWCSTANAASTVSNAFGGTTDDQPQLH